MPEVKHAVTEKRKIYFQEESILIVLLIPDYQVFDAGLKSDFLIKWFSAILHVFSRISMIEVKPVVTEKLESEYRNLSNFLAFLRKLGLSRF